MTRSKTYLPAVDKIQHRYYVIDAKDKILGKVATKAAVLLRGKHKRDFTPYLDSGDHVIIINAQHFKVTGRKLKQKEYRRYSGYPSGLKVLTLEQLMAKSPTQAMRLAVERMIPTGPLGYKQRRRLKVFAGNTHPHQAQKPVPVDF